MEKFAEAQERSGTGSKGYIACAFFHTCKDAVKEDYRTSGIIKILGFTLSTF